MELTTSGFAAPTRVALQIIANYKRPHIEVYEQLRNVHRPASTNLQGHRWHDIFIHLFLANIGGTRAENVVLELVGDFTYHGNHSTLSSRAPFTGKVIPQIVPGQQITLMKCDIHDLNVYPEGGGKPIGFKESPFTIVIKFNGPRAGLNRILRWWSDLRGKHQFENRYTFDPRLYDGVDLPPDEYQ